MNKVKSIAFLVLLLLIINCESKSQITKGHIKVHTIMLQIPDSLTHTTQNLADYINLKINTPNEKAWAIYCWIADNIEYDFENRYAIDMYSSKLSPNETLKSRKGVCVNYTNLYADIANKVGIKTYVITGYTRKKKLVNQNPHSWCASLIDSSWYMIDPTWGAGYIQNSHYVKELDKEYFMIQPTIFIKTHIPFDPLWQFLYYPITKQEFYNGLSKAKNEDNYFNYIDTLKIYDKQSKLQRLLSSSSRIKSNGISSYLDYINLSDIKFNINLLYKNRDKKLYNIAYNYYSEGIYLLNEYINYANKHYLPYKSDSEIKQMLEDVEKNLNLALAQLEKNEYRTSIMENETLQLKKSISQELVDLKRQKNRLGEYLKIAKQYRESLSNSNVK